MVGSVMGLLPVRNEKIPSNREVRGGHSFLKVRPQLSFCRQPQLPDDQAEDLLRGGNSEGMLPVVSHRSRGYGPSSVETPPPAHPRPSTPTSRTAGRGLARFQAVARSVGTVAGGGTWHILCRLRAPEDEARQPEPPALVFGPRPGRTKNLIAVVPVDAGVRCWSRQFDETRADG